MSVFQVKKLQVMLRQANDQLERTMTEKQSLEDSVKVGNEETAAKVWTQWIYYFKDIRFSPWCGSDSVDTSSYFQYVILRLVLNSPQTL